MQADDLFCVLFGPRGMISYDMVVPSGVLHCAFSCLLLLLLVVVVVVLQQCKYVYSAIAFLFYHSFILYRLTRYISM